MAKSRRKRRRKRRRKNKSTPVFKRWNYILVCLGLLAVVVGFALMRLENQVDGVLSLYVAPLLILGGYLEIIYAILWRSEPSTSDAQAAGSG